MELRVKVGETDRANLRPGSAAVGVRRAAGRDPLGEGRHARRPRSPTISSRRPPCRQFDVTLKLDKPDPRLLAGASVAVDRRPPGRERAAGAAAGGPRRTARPSCSCRTATASSRATSRSSTAPRAGPRRRPRRRHRGRPGRSRRRRAKRSIRHRSRREPHEGHRLRPDPRRRASRRPAHPGADFLPELRLGFDNLRAHKLRSLLTMLGMIFGVAAVVAMLSIGAGAQQQVMAFIEQLGVRNLIVEAREAGDYQSLQNVRKISAGLSFQDLRSIRRTSTASPRRRRASGFTPTKLMPKPQGDMPIVYGVSPGYQHRSPNLRSRAGRFFDDGEDAGRRAGRGARRGRRGRAVRRQRSASASSSR